MPRYSVFAPRVTLLTGVSSMSFHPSVVPRTVTGFWAQDFSSIIGACIMSETTTTADTTGEATESATRAGHTTRKAAKATKDGVNEIARLAYNGADDAKEVAHSVIDTVADTADAAAAASSKIAEQSREVYMMATRTAADVSGRVADIGLDRSHKVLTSTAHALDVYRDASERSAERVQALFAS